MVEPTIEKKGQYNNLILKTKVVNGQVIQGVNPGEKIVVEKIKYAEGLKIEKFDRPSYICNVLYKDTECSFFLKEEEHKDFAASGGVGDKIELSIENQEYSYNGEKKTKQVVKTVLV